jgi:hypothetical protein
MNTIQNDIRTFNDELVRISLYFDKVLNEQIPVDFNEINKLVEGIEKKRVKLKNKYPKELLKNNSDNVTYITKQIVNTLDNIIRNKEVEKQTAANELKKLQNKKKIANYIR